MGPRRRLITLALVLAAGGCKDKGADTAPASSSLPRDQLAPGELPEGKERAFTLPIPLHCDVRAKFDKSIHIASEYSHEQLANFVRTRVTSGTVAAGVSETRFEKVEVAKDRSRVLTITVRGAPLGAQYKSQMVVSDVTPPPPDPTLKTDEDRWRKAGFRPNGQPIDPNSMQ